MNGCGSNNSIFRKCQASSSEFQHSTYSAGCSLILPHFTPPHTLSAHLQPCQGCFAATDAPADLFLFDEKVIETQPPDNPLLKLIHPETHCQDIYSSEFKNKEKQKVQEIGGTITFYNDWLSYWLFFHLFLSLEMFQGQSVTIAYEEFT